MQEYHELIRYNKEIVVLMTLCNYIKGHSMSGETLSEVMDQQSKFLLMEPVARGRFTGAGAQLSPKRCPNLQFFF